MSPSFAVNWTLAAKLTQEPRESAAGQQLSAPVWGDIKGDANHNRHQIGGGVAVRIAHFGRDLHPAITVLDAHVSGRAAGILGKAAACGALDLDRG